MRLWRHLALKLRKYNETKQTGYAGDLKRKWAEWKEKNKLIIKKKRGKGRNTNWRLANNLFSQKGLPLVRAT